MCYLRKIDREELFPRLRESETAFLIQRDLAALDPSAEKLRARGAPLYAYFLYVGGHLVKFRSNELDLFELISCPLSTIIK
jgi:hypothetical protein